MYGDNNAKTLLELTIPRFLFSAEPHFRDFLCSNYVSFINTKILAEEISKIFRNRDEYISKIFL